MGWCYCVRFNVCFYGYGRFCLLFSHRDCLKKSGEKRKILDGLINISIHSFRLLCFFIFLNSLFPFGCCLLSSLSLGSSCQRIWRTWGVGYWVVLTILGLFRGLLSWVFSTVQSCFTCCDNSGVYLWFLGRSVLVLLWFLFFSYILVWILGNFFHLPFLFKKMF